jgi:hypothetical protein
MTLRTGFLGLKKKLLSEMVVARDIEITNAGVWEFFLAEMFHHVWVFLELTIKLPLLVA